MFVSFDISIDNKMLNSSFLLSYSSGGRLQIFEFSLLNGWTDLSEIYTFQKFQKLKVLNSTILEMYFLELLKPFI